MRSLEFDPSAFEDLAWWIEQHRAQALRIVDSRTRSYPYPCIWPSNAYRRCVCCQTQAIAAVKFQHARTVETDAIYLAKDAQFGKVSRFVSQELKLAPIFRRSFPPER